MYQSDCSNLDISLLKKRNIQSETDRYFQEAFYRMDSMRECGLFCDVTLVTKNVEILAHKVVLASRSDFFHDSFVKMGDENHLFLLQIDGNALSALINYIYTSRIKIESVANVEDLLMGANILQLKNIREECCKYLENNLNLNTSLQVLTIAQNQKYLDLLKKTEDFIDENITEIINTQGFLNLSFNQLTHLISRDTLNVPSEERIYEGVISWVKHDLTRTKHLSVLMSRVRLTLISKDYLAKYIRNEPLFKANIQCKNLIIDTALCENIPQMNKPKARKGSQSHQVLLIMGGDPSGATETFELYDFKTKHWSQIYSMPAEKSAYNLAFVNRKLYVVSYDDITEYDLVNNCWGNSIKMHLSRSWCGVGVLNDSIYVVGGYFNGERYKSVEKFDVSNQKWSFIGPMSIGRFWNGVGELDGLLYVVGGRSYPNTLLKSVEFYDPKLNVWKESSDLIIARTSAAIGSLHNKLYVIGGSDGYKSLSSVECYSPASNEFTLSASLNIPRSGSAVVTFDDKLYIIGGRDGSRLLNNIEVYCPKNDKWELLPTTMNVARYLHGAVIVDKLIDF